MKINKSNFKRTTKAGLFALALAFGCNHIQAQNLNLGLCACYPLDCDNAVDAGPNGYNASPLPAGVTCTTGHMELANTAYRFNGTAGSHIELPYPGTCMNSNTAISWSGWVKTEDEKIEQYLVFAWNGCANYHEGYTMVMGRYLGGNNYGFAVAKSDGCNGPSNQVVLNSSFSALAKDTWYHVGMVVTNTSLKIYINGILDTQVVHAKPFLYPATGTNVYLGGSNRPYELPFLGSMDNVRFYSRELSALEFSVLALLDPPCNDCGLATSFQNKMEACYPLDCDVVNYAATSAIPPSLDGNTSNVNCATDRAGNVNSAYSFNGNANSFISFPNDARLKPSAVTIACYVKIDQLQTDQYIIFTHNGCTFWHEGYAIVAHASGGNVYYEAVKSGNCSGSSQIVVNSSAAPSSTNNWQCVVAYFDAGNIKLYVDGVSYSTTGGTSLLYDANALVYLGGTTLGYNRPLNGRIDNVRIWSKELTPGEIMFLCDNDIGCTENWCRNDFRPGQATGLIKEKSTTSTMVYPNPNAGSFVVKGSSANHLLVTDITGKEVSFNSIKTDDNTIEVTLSDECEGIYLVKFFTDQGEMIGTKKFVIQK